jgi:predicted O-linked N-acetylglucosamine transferase (SPINDLY family)
MLVGSLRQQPLESLLDLAISLASKSLSRTMEAFQVACNCWAFSSDSDAAAYALGVAEECMARTMHRMQIVQQLAAAVLSRKQSQALAAHQEQQQQRLLNMMQVLQGQCLGTVPEDEEEGEEVSSSWKPAGQL